MGKDNDLGKIKQQQKKKKKAVEGKNPSSSSERRRTSSSGMGGKLKNAFRSPRHKRHTRDDSSAGSGSTETHRLLDDDDSSEGYFLEESADDADDGNPFTESGDSSTSPDSGRRNRPRSFSLTAGHRQAKNDKNLKIGRTDLVPNGGLSISEEGEVNDPDLYSRLLLRQNSFQRSFSQVIPSASGGNISAGPPSRFSMTQRIMIGSTSAESLPRLRGSVSLDSLASSDGDSAPPPGVSAIAPVHLTQHNPVKDFTPKQVYLALSNKFAQQFERQKVLEQRVQKIFESQAKLIQAVNNQTRAAQHTNADIRSVMEMLSEISRGAEYHSYNRRDNMPSVWLEAKKAPLASTMWRADDPDDVQTDGCGSFSLHDFFCNCFS